MILSESDHLRPRFFSGFSPTAQVASQTIFAKSEFRVRVFVNVVVLYIFNVKRVILLHQAKCVGSTQLLREKVKKFAVYSLSPPHTKAIILAKFHP